MGRKPNDLITFGEVEEFDFRKEMAAAAEHFRAPVRKKSGLEVSVTTAMAAFRLADIAYVVLSQRNPSYADGRKVTRGENIGLALAIPLITQHLWLHGTEALRRYRDGRSLVSIDSEQKVEVSNVVGDSVALGIGIAQLRNGRSLFKKREYSAYGRVFMVASTAAGALGAALRVHKAIDQAVG